MDTSPVGEMATAAGVGLDGVVPSTRLALRSADVPSAAAPMVSMLSAQGLMVTVLPVASAWSAG